MFFLEGTTKKRSHNMCFFRGDDKKDFFLQGATKKIFFTGDDKKDFFLQGTTKKDFFTGDGNPGNLFL